MDAFNALSEAFGPVRDAFLQSPALSRMASGGIERSHYASYLTQVYHHTRENPQIQALATVWFRGEQRSVIKRFYRHATSEIGHDELALEDLQALGVPCEHLPTSNPLPETTALIAFPFHQIQNLDPIGYLGYLYFLEFLPTGSGPDVMRTLARAGVPADAMRFLHDHSTIDVAHNRLMQEYVAVLIRDERALRSAIYAMRVTGKLYARMIEAAFDDADAPVDYGVSATECCALSSESAELTSAA
jgi:pyrroloquinoline quinone (PQQ) biosynthesis protein C